LSNKYLEHLCIYCGNPLLQKYPNDKWGDASKYYGECIECSLEYDITEYQNTIKIEIVKR